MKVLITSGGTREKIDPVRFIGNYSSGKMGKALEEAFLNINADVTIVAGSGEVQYKSKTVKVESAVEMFEAVKQALPVDIAVFAAAVADKRPKFEAKEKTKKEFFNNIELVENPDILSEIANSSQRPKLVIGFAAESDSHIQNARKKLTNKSCDLIILNDINAIGSDQNEVWLIGKDFEKKLPKATKDKIAEEIIKIILGLYEQH